MLFAENDKRIGNPPVSAQKMERVRFSPVEPQPLKEYIILKTYSDWNTAYVRVNRLDVDARRIKSMMSFHICKFYI